MRLDLEEGRYDRQELITWWDQARLAEARVLVVGAGALGNEIMKNLALIGVGRLEVIDLDHIERSNLARCVLFRDEDEGRSKVEAALDGVARLNPSVDVHAHEGNVLDRGIGWVTGFDLVIAGLDNREARAWVNEACRKMSVPWVDGAIEGLRGIARVFLPEGPCYECTLGEVDRKLLAMRRSCALLTPKEMASGRVPTTATTSAIVAAVEVQEAVKILVGKSEMLAAPNSAWVYLGETLETYRVIYEEDPYCLVHDTYASLRSIAQTPGMTLRNLMDLATLDGLGVDAVELEGEVVVGRRCLACDIALDDSRWVRSIPPEDATCHQCGEPYQIEFRRSLAADDPLLDVPITTIGLPPNDVVTIRAGAIRSHLLLEAS